MDSVLVIGGMGKIGSFVTKKLMQQGARTIVYQRHKNTILLKDIADKVEYVEGDVLDLPRLILTIKDYGIDRVINMATFAGPALEGNPFIGYRANVEGGLNVLEACRVMGVKRLLFMSSKAVYAPVQGEYAPPTQRPIDEDYPKDPRRVYGATKLFIENMGLIYNRLYGLDFIVLRFGSCYGPGKASGPGTAAIRSKIIESAMLGKPLKLPWCEDVPDDLVYHRDLADAIVLACFVKDPEHRVFHLGRGTGTTVRQIIAVLEKMFGKVPVEIDWNGLEKLGLEVDRNSCIYDIGRARQELGYHPRYDLDNGIKDYVDTMRQMNVPPGI